MIAHHMALRAGMSDNKVEKNVNLMIAICEVFCAHLQPRDHLALLETNLKLEEDLTFSA